MTQMTLAQLRAWMVDQIGTFEVRAIRAPRGDSGLGSDIGTAIPDVSPEDSTGTVSGDEQRWARIVTQDGTNPDAAGAVEVSGVAWGTGQPQSPWLSPDAVPGWIANGGQ